MAIATAARLYSDHVGQSSISQWHSILRMLENLRDMFQSENLDVLHTISQFVKMNVGDVLALPIRTQNAGVVFRKQKDITIFESFEISPMVQDVMTTEGKLICSYPGPAIEIPNLVFDDKDFLSELVNFLIRMDRDVLDTAPQSPVFKDTIHPRYITELLTGILRGVGRPADIIRTRKRVGDEVVCNDDPQFPWRRSALWLFIRVALQTTLDRAPLGRDAYKGFMLFFMCCLADEKTCGDLPSDLLHFMSAKISRRLRKLGSSAPDWLSSTVLQTCTSLRSIIENRWQQVQATQRLSPLWTPSQLNLPRDIRLSLSSSEDYILASLVNHSAAAPNVPFDPQHRRRGYLYDFLSSDGHFFEEAYRLEPHVTLFDLERGVEQGIDAWVDQITDNSEACVKLEILADKYSLSACKTYANNPELLSVMLLTTIELWVALDKITIKEIPILADYSPEVPTSLLEQLLLCRTASLQRLRYAQEYLSRRHSQSRSQWSVFSSAITADSFAVRFYRGSLHLRNLKARIEGVARREVRKKVAELQEQNIRSARRFFPTSDDISVHVWPLPADPLQAEVVLFELDCPVSFRMWRAATFHLLVDICSPSVRRRGGPRINLDSYEALETYFVEHSRSRITLGSNTRSLVEPHDTVSIPADVKQVCVKNDLEFFLFDTRTGIPISEALGRSNGRGLWTYKLPSGPYHNLQKYIDSTSHTSNEVIANQADCHRDLSLYEYMAFAHLRSGGLLQWLNILRELRGRSLSFRRHEVHMLLAQAVSQVGPLENTEWTWHQELQEPIFCLALLAELRSLVQDVQANWAEAVTMDTISFLVRRLLGYGLDPAVSIDAVSLLRTMRSMVFSWVQELLSRVMNTPGDEELRGILRDTAAICRSTFNVDPATIPRILHSAEDIDVLLSSANIIRDHMPSDTSRLPTYSQLLLHRDRHLSLALECILSNIIQADSRNEGINLAVERIWPHYRPGSKWTPLHAPNSRWFWCTTAPQADQSPQVVHLNVLDGSLLVNGRPFGIWLPNDFVQHPLYKQVFGEQMLAVTQGDLAGMDYSTRDLICDHQVCFSLINSGSTLVIRAKRKGMVTGDSAMLELIPHERLVGDLPAVLIEGHAHWLNLSTSLMEIRPLHSLWKHSSENWKIDCTRGHYCMRKGNEYLVDIRSRSWEMVSSLIRPLSSPQDLIISASLTGPDHPTSSLQLSVVLPRFGLSFYIDEDGDLQSCDFRGMVYDENQSIGTFFGLVNQLVLRPKNRDINSLELIPRCVLIPDGNISFRMQGHHARVEIATDHFALERVTYQTYRINTDLGCLTGNGSLTSKLYCAYLHALTNGISPDPLTGRSGKEEALSILQSASCWSNMKFSCRDACLLGLIASMCPSRTFETHHRMQKIEWRNLPVNSQNPEFYVISKAIKEHYETVELSYGSPSIPLFREFPLRDDHLLKRSAGRAAYLLPSEFVRQPLGAGFDARYPARDLVGVTSGEHRACTAATYVYSQTGMGTRNIWKMVKSWKNVSGASGDTALSLQYDRSWLAPDLPSIWLKTYNLLRESDERKWFRMLFSLPAMAYGSSDLRDLVPVFVAFASHPQFRSEDPPHHNYYFFAAGFYPSSDVLSTYVVKYAHPFERSPERWAEFDTPNLDDLEDRRLQAYNSRRRSDANATAERLLHAWPCETPPPCLLDPMLYDVADLESEVQRHFSRRFPNFQLKAHLARVQIILSSLRSRSFHILPYSFQPSQSIHSRIWPPMLHQLLARPAPVLPPRDVLCQDAVHAGKTSTSPFDSTLLQQLIVTVEARVANPFQRQYVSALHTSGDSFGKTLMEHYARCKASYIEAFHLLQRHLGPRGRSEEAVEQSAQWPRITAHILFRSLASNSPATLPGDWKKCLVGFTLLALELQRARRLVLLHFNNLHEELHREILNEGCDGWDAEAHPDWLLIQLEGNFLIRRVQSEVANEMISPHSGGNTAMQLNMGEGKSSMIIPIVAAVLANGNQLVRVVVPKPLTLQTLHLLTDRLSWLTNRRIYYLPFSRSTAANDEIVESLRHVMLECMQERGILVVQPDHILSLKLVSVEKQFCHRKAALSHQLLELQRWLHSYSRDVLDESDEILDARSQLVFTIGCQQHVEGSPERWTITEQILGLVGKHAYSLQKLFPHGVEYEPGPPGSFPYFRIMQSEAAQKLISWIVEDVMEGLLPNISFGQLHLHLGLRDVIRVFISCEQVSPASVQLVKECYGRTVLWGGLLLLRGLLANGILAFAFTDRRWRVDYGLSPTRTMLAVPYRAKDVPAQKAEFGHPDIAIILTCLSYYYGGLNEEQLRLSFAILFKQHDVPFTYDLWVRACPVVPESLRTISGINIQSVEQWNKSLFPLFSRNRETVNFYLSNIVFPREAKEFPSKLSSSGWDLAEKKERLLTGFSGTNDAQYLLPLHIAQCDPDHQRGTNAKVLSYLLQPENNHYMCTARKNNDRRNSHEFLQILTAQKPEIRVLLDVGAQVLDLQNHELAKAWLDISPSASAAIYFNEDDELMVRPRDGTTQLLRSSPFAQQLDRCVVYLDDVHTRGTDIEFPAGFRAAVTLGSKVTKDRLSQGCMRMRKLGHGHSVMFFAPLEIDRRIRAVAGKDKDPLDAIDILHWAIQETWTNIQRWAPHWVQQGVDHEYRYAAWSSFCSGQLTPKQLSDKWIQPEAKTLEDLYGPRSPSDLALLASADIRRRCNDFGVLSLSPVGMDEEQERELMYEVRRERQVVERSPLRVLPASHTVHQDVIAFVKTGVISTRFIFFKIPNKGFSPVFDSLSATSAATNEPFIWSQSVLVTKDFEKTVQLSEGKMDDYLRPVHWVLSAKRESGVVLVILSPYEANCLLPDIRSSDKVHLHLYAARVTKSVKPCNDLGLYSIPTVPDGWLLPSSLTDQLAMFAGELYLKDYETYLRLCRFLCVYTRELRGEEDIVVEPDGFIKPMNRNNRMAHTFSNSPLIALRALMSLRNKDIDFTATHLGKLLHGELLSEDDFDG